MEENIIMNIKEKVLKDGYVIGNNILKVDSFINHQVDTKLIDELGEYFSKKFTGVTKILTIETSGIAFGVGVARYYNYVPLVFAKKSKSKIVDENNLYTTVVDSFTKGTSNVVSVDRRFLSENDKVLIVDDFMAEGNDGGAEHHLFVGTGDAYIVRTALQPKDEGQDVLQLITEIVIGLIQTVGPFLHPDKALQTVQTQHIFSHRNEEKVGDLLPAVLLFHGVCDQLSFHIVGDHGIGEAVFLQRVQVLGYIFGGLLQIQPHGGNLLIAGQAEAAHSSGQQLLLFLCHLCLSLPGYYRTKERTLSTAAKKLVTEMT